MSRWVKALIAVAAAAALAAGGYFAWQAYRAAHAEEAAAEEAAPEERWGEAEEPVPAISASDIAGIENTDLTEAELDALVAALDEAAWEEQSLAEGRLTIEEARPDAGSTARKFKITNAADGKEYTLRLAGGKWKVTAGFTEAAEKATPASGEGAPAEQGQPAAQDAAPAQEPAPAAQGQAAPAQEQQARPRIHSNAAFDEAAASALGTQAVTDALGQAVASRLLADINAYLEPTGVSVAAASDVSVACGARELKGSVLRFSALAVSGANRMVFRCTYDVGNLKHSIVLQD